MKKLVISTVTNSKCSHQKEKQIHKSVVPYHTVNIEYLEPLRYKWDSATRHLTQPIINFLYLLESQTYHNNNNAALEIGF